ncbi:MAG: hypothetical protein G01um101470_882 [Parcubacteria group bacterium Gr01-1014_70]|nr:MAG: hypothetical protein G01um101470_882 [Parcubacteria group bacterium Gr01-1014_70]
MPDYRFLFIDLETTGHDTVRNIHGVLMPYHEIIEVGAVLTTQKFEVLGTFERKVLPTYPERCLPNLINNYQERARNGEWDFAVSIQTAIQELLVFSDSFSGPKALIGQNVAFDWSFLLIALAQCRISSDDLMALHNIHYGKIDTRSMSIQELWQTEIPFDPNEYSLRKLTLSQKLGIPDELFPHTALNGAMKCYEVFKKLREMRTMR